MRNRQFFLSLLFGILIFSSCRKDETLLPEENLQQESDREKFVGDWEFRLDYYHEGFEYDSISDDYVFVMWDTTYWVKQGSVRTDPKTYNGLIINYGPNEDDFTVISDPETEEVTCIENIQNAGYDSVASYATIWYLIDSSSSGPMRYTLGYYPGSTASTYSIKGNKIE